ncbi:hypothetical protein [Pantoea rodasii]|nr:hypothetical protein [Pantoea rodasii]
MLADRNRDDATQCVIAIDIDHFKKKSTTGTAMKRVMRY